MTNFTTLRFILIFLIFQISVLKAQDVKIQDKTFAELFDIASACLDTSNGNCESEFRNCTDYLNTLKSDTLAGSYFLMLGNKRMRAGRWDELSHNIFAAANKRNRASGEPCAIVKSQFALTRFARFKGNTDSSLVLANRSLEAATACGDKSKIAQAENYLGSAFANNSAYSKGLTHFQEADRLYTSIGDSLGLATVMLDMSAMYSQMHEKVKARDYTMKAARLFKSAGEEMRYAIALIDFCAYLVDVQLADSALTVLPIAEEIIHGKNPRAEAYMEQNYGGANYLKKQYKKAIEHYKKAIVLNEKVGDIGLSILLNLFMAQSYRKAHQYSEAYIYAVRADSLAENTPRNFKRSQAYLELARSAYTSHHFGISNASFENFLTLRDSLLGADKRTAIAEMENSYEAEKKQKQIEFAEQENALLESKNKASTNRNYALAACLVLLTLVSIGLVSRKNGKLKIQRARMDVHTLENEKLNQELAHRKRELSSKALFIARNNEVLSDLKNELQRMPAAESIVVESLTRKLRIKEIQDKNWDSFITQFNDLNPNFHKAFATNYGRLTKSEMRLAALIRMGINTKDIAIMLNISEQGVKKARHRLRKKMDIESSENLENLIMQV